MFSTDPLADLSVDEDEVVQGQDYFCRTTSPSSKAEPNSTVSPGQNHKRNQVSHAVLTHARIFGGPT